MGAASASPFDMALSLGGRAVDTFAAYLFRQQITPEAFKMTPRYQWTTGEPELHDILHDDVLQAVMRRDGVSRQDLDALIDVVQRRLQRTTSRPHLPRPANDDDRRPSA